MSEISSVGIVGGGLVGKQAAYLSAKEGYETTVFESNRDYNILPQCGEGIWEKKLQKVEIEVEDEHVQNVIETLKLGFASKNSKRWKYADIEKYLILDRLKFEKNIFEKLQSEGATFKTGSLIRDLNELKDFDIILGAWGSYKTCPKPFDSYEKKTAYGLQYNMKNVEMENAKTIVFDTIPEIMYFYVFPKGKKKANVGVCMNSPFLKEHLDNFIKNEESLREGEIERKFSKLINCSRPLVQYSPENVILIGEAGGFCDAVSCGGIGYGLESAKYAVESLESENPQETFFELSDELVEKLNTSYELANKFYYSSAKKRKKQIELLHRNFSDFKDKKTSLSLSKILKEVLMTD